jgi:hypothetical protein
MSKKNTSAFGNASYQIQFVLVRDPLILGYSFSLDAALFDHFRPSVINIQEFQDERK